MTLRTLAIALALLVLSACTVQMAPSVKPSAPITNTVAQQERVAGDVDVPPTAAELSGAVLPERLLPGGILEVGQSEAGMTMLIFTNYSCEYCRRLDAERMPQVLRTYVQTGKMRVDIVSLDLKKYPDSNETARMLLCAAAQGKGQKMHAFLFTKPTNPALMQKEIAVMGIDGKQMGACLQSPELNPVREQQQSLARVLNVTLIPAYFLNGTPYIGLPEDSELQAQIDQALSAR